MEKNSLKKAGNTTQAPLVRDRDLLLALSRASQSIQRARTAQDFYHAVGREIKSLGGTVTLLTITEDRRSLLIAYTSYSTVWIHRVEELTGLSAQDYLIPIQQNGYYEQVLKNGQAIFYPSTNEVVAESLPQSVRALVEPVMRLLKLGSGIMAPLLLENETLGLMTVSGFALTAEHLPAMESFAGQIATGLFNVRLTQQLTEELAARRRAEDILQHSRDLLLALSQAAQAVQKMTDQQGIYRVVVEQIKALGFESAILMLDEDKKHLFLEYTTLTEQAVRLAEKTLGLTAQEYHWPILLDNMYHRIIDLGKAEYTSDASALFTETLPVQTRPMSGQIMRILGAEKGIVAPLRVDEGTFGLLVVFGNQPVSEEDLPAMDSFAGQVAISLRNLRLSQQIATELTERKQAEERLRSAGHSLELAHYELQRMFAHEQTLARTDSMTGLFNRRHFFELALREFSISLRYNRPMTIILFDVDDFKQVNDTFGHDMGDATLTQIAQAASQQVRSVDILARYGGDEFIILLPETNAQQAFQIAERMRERVASTGAGMENSPFVVTISLGVAEVSHSPQDASVEDVIRRADQALYAAKAKGCHCTVIHGHL